MICKIIVFLGLPIFSAFCQASKVDRVFNDPICAAANIISRQQEKIADSREGLSEQEVKAIIDQSQKNRKKISCEISVK